MKEVFLLKEGEIALKGLNRHVFEETFTRNLRRRLSPLGKFKIHCAQSTVYIERVGRVLVFCGLLPHAVVSSLEAGHDGVIDVPVGAVDLRPRCALAAGKAEGKRVFWDKDSALHPRDWP